MKQIISDIRCFVGETSQLDPQMEKLIFKSIIDNPESAHSGVMIIDGESFTKLTMDKVNYAFIFARHPFSLSLDNKVVIYTKHFSFANVNTVMNLTIYPRLRYKVEVTYLYGYVNYQSNQSPIQLPEGCCQEEYDEILQNLIIDPGQCNFYPDWAQHMSDPDCCDNCSYDKTIEDIIFVTDKDTCV